MEKKTYPLIDVMKLFFCFCILFRHTGAYHDIPLSYYIQHGVFCLAVPFFFVVSGYFFGTGLGRYSLLERIKKYELRLAKPYIFFSLINIVLAAIDLYQIGETPLWILLKLCRSIIFYPYGALWYVWASMTGMLLLYWFLKNNKGKLAIVCGLIGYAFALLCNNYYFLVLGTKAQRIVDLYLKITTSARNGIFVGFIFLGIGYQLSQFEKRIRTRKSQILICLATILSWLIMLGEIIWIKGKITADDNSLFIMQILFIPLFVLTLLHANLSTPPSYSLSILCRNLSVGIYFLHRPVLSLLRYNVWFANLSGTMQFVILSWVCTLFCLAVYAAKREPLYSLLR